jgi:hypothetical protein
VNDDDDGDTNPDMPGIASDEAQAELYELIVDACHEQGESPGPTEPAE